jgi:hypothetical protein
MNKKKQEKPTTENPLPQFLSWLLAVAAAGLQNKSFFFLVDKK